MKKRGLCMLMTVVLLLGLLPAAALAADAPWAQEAVDTLNRIYDTDAFAASDTAMLSGDLEALLVAMGRSDAGELAGDFSDPVTRAEACQVLAEVFSIPIPSGGTAIEYFFERGIINGRSPTDLDEDGQVSKAQFAVLTYRVLNATGGGLGTKNGLELKPGTKEYFSWLYLGVRRGSVGNDNVDEGQWNGWAETLRNAQAVKEGDGAVAKYGSFGAPAGFDPAFPGELSDVEAAVRMVDACMAAGGCQSIFGDVRPGDRWYDGVMYLADQGIITGYGHGDFQPDTELTYTHLAVLLYRAAGSPAWEVPGEDLGGDSPEVVRIAMAFCVDMGYLADPPAGWDTSVSREEAVVSILKLCADEGCIPADWDSVNTAILDRFADGEAVSEEARPYLAYAVSLGLIGGTAENELLPQENALRVQAAIILYRTLLGPDPTKMRDYGESVDYAMESGASAYALRASRTYTLTLREDWRLTADLDLAVPGGEVLVIDGGGQYHIYEMGGKLLNSGGGTVEYAGGTSLFTVWEPVTVTGYRSGRVDFTANPGAPGTLLVCAASYESITGRLLDAVLEEVSVTEGENTVELPSLPDGDVRVFLLDAAAFTPLCESHRE